MHKLLEKLSQLEIFEDKYRFLIDLGHENTNGLTAEEKTNETTIPGCASRSWLVCSNLNGKLFFRCYSKSQMIHGMLVLLCEVISGKAPQEISTYNFQEFETAGIGNLLTPTRVNGFGNAILLVKSYAIKYYND
jgi:cysteine desulfuration protein SufE